MLSPYSLEIISAHKSFRNKSLRKYAIDGVDTVGAWGDEPFEIKFRNNTRNKIQVKVSVDGTDVLTCKPADTEISSDMWVVQGHSTLNLKAWPETKNGGAQFVFTHADKSVALNTHGDMSSKGIIAVAVYEEGHVKEPNVHHHYHWHTPYYDYSLSDSSGDWKGHLRRSKSSFSDITRGINTNDVTISSCDSSNNLSLDDVAVGAGSFVDQKITYVTGLIEPKLSEIVKVRYVWWDDLKATLEKNGYANQTSPDGFPGDKKLVDLGNIPRVDTSGNHTKGFFRRAEETFSRF